MSTWQQRRYYSSDEQSHIIAKLIQKAILAASETKKVQDDLIQLGDLIDSNCNITESLYAKTASQFTVWKMPLEPDHNQCRLWLHANTTCQLDDLSAFGAIAKVYGRYTRMILGYDDGICGNVLNPYIDGITNYIRITDNANVRLNNIVGTKAGISFVVRAYATSLSLDLGGSKRFLFTKIDDDLVTFGYEAFFDDTGVIYFVVRKNGTDYKMKTSSPALTPQRDYSDFDSADYKAVDYYTHGQPIYFPDDLIDEFVFTFKFSDNTMQIFKNAVSLTLASTTEAAVFPTAISNPPPLNAAIKLTVSAMTASGGTNIPYAYDNNLTTRWEQTTGSLPMWLTFDAGQIKTIAYVEISWYRGALGRICDFEIYVSDDNITFVKVYTGQGLGTDALQRYVFPPVTGRYVKLNITGNSEGVSASVYEFNVWGYDPTTIVYPITTVYNVPVTGGDYIDLYYTPQGSSTDAVFGVTGTTSTDTQLRIDSGKTTVYSAGGSGTGIAIHAAQGLTAIFSATGTEIAFGINGFGQTRIGEVAATGSVLLGQTIASIKVRMKRVGSPPAGTQVYAQMWKGGNNYPSQTILYASSVSTTATDYTFDFSTVTQTMAVNDVLGVQYGAGDGANYIAVSVLEPPSGGSSDSTKTYGASYQSTWQALGGSTSNDVYMSVYTGGGVPMHIVGEYIVNSSSVFFGKVLSQVTVKMSKTGTLSSGSIYCRIRKSGGATIAADATIAASTLTTSFVAYTFNFTGNAYVMAVNDQLEVQFDGGDNANYVNVQFDTSGVDTTNGILRQQDTSLNWTTDTAKDLAGTMLQNNAPPIYSVGEYIADNTSVLYNKIITKATFKLARVGSPAGSTYCYILLPGGSYVASPTVIANSSLPISNGSNYQATDFLFTGNAHSGGVGDTIYVFTTGGDVSNYVVAQREVNSASGDGVHTIMRVRDYTDTWSSVTTDDSACTMYVTTVIPAAQVNRCDMYSQGDFGTFVNHTLNDFTFYLKKAGAPTGTIYFRIRDLNDAIVEELGTYNAASLTTSNATINFVNIANFNHMLVKGDKICVEYTSVTQLAADRVKVQQNSKSTYFTDPDTIEQSFNNISWSPVSDRVLAGIYKEGGQTVVMQQIDLGIEQIAQPGYTHDLFLLTCAEYETLSKTWTLKQGFWKGIFSQFRIYYDLLTLTQIQNLYANKISISAINYGEVLTGGTLMNLQP